MLFLKLAIDRMLGSVMRRITNHWYEWPWRDPGAALRNELQRRATLAAADFVTTRMPDALYCGGKFDLLTYAVKQAPPGLALEFGVFKGTTINHLAKQAQDRRFYGFDSFTGLPDQWTGARYSPVNFDRGGKKPKVASNVTLIEGWFDKTLAAFLAREREPIAFIHVDCDIYASAKTVLELAMPPPGARRRRRVRRVLQLQGLRAARVQGVLRGRRALRSQLSLHRLRRATGVGHDRGGATARSGCVT